MKPLTADEAEMIRRAARPGPSEMSPLGDRAEDVTEALVERGLGEMVDSGRVIEGDEGTWDVWVFEPNARGRAALAAYDAWRAGR